MDRDLVRVDVGCVCADVVQNGGAGRKNGGAVRKLHVELFDGGRVLHRNPQLFSAWRLGSRVLDKDPEILFALIIRGGAQNTLPYLEDSASLSTSEIANVRTSPDRTHLRHEEMVGMWTCLVMEGTEQ